MVGNTSDILISVKGEYVSRILSGEKTVELRRRSVNVTPGTRVWIYTTKPHARITLCATVKQVIVSSPSDIWKDYGHLAGVTRSEFNNYFEGSSTACGIVMCKIRKVAPAPSLDELRIKSSSFHPPQFFKRMLPGDDTLNLLRMRITPLALSA